MTTDSKRVEAGSASAGRSRASVADFRDLYAGGTIIVCGCGESLNDLSHPERFVTIGVNDVGRQFQPTYLVVVNPRNQFVGDRFRYVETSQAQALFTQLDLGVAHPNVVRFRLGSYGGTDFSKPEVLHYTQNSPYVALCLAAHMGAALIGVIGVDFTDHHFFAKTGRHSLSPQLATIDQQYRRLGDALHNRGVEVFNLSTASRLTAFPKLDLDEFIARADLPPTIEPPLYAPDHEQTATVQPSDIGPLNIVSYATTPVAGVPAILARCINARTSHKARCVWARNDYGNGVSFPGDLQWNERPADAEAVIRDADLVIVHNGHVDTRHQRLLSDKPVITMAHNYMWNVDQSFVQKGMPGVVIGQYQATLPEFEGWSVVPNPIPIWEDEFRPGEKEPDVTICYTPSGKHERYPANHRLYWHSKGYNTTIATLERLAARFKLRLEVIRSRQVSHSESLAMKRRSHVVIDECVTGSYHRNSLEGLAAGCVVVNGIGLLSGVSDVFHHCARDRVKTPFNSASLENLEAVLASLIEEGGERLIAEGRHNREWMERHWDFRDQWNHFWAPVVAESLHRAGRRPQVNISAATVVPATPHIVAHEKNNVSNMKQGLSLVICHGGKERVPHLAASLANLKQCDGLTEVVIVDMGETPVARDLARRWRTKYVFVKHSGIFERARALNVGTALAECDVVMWKDNDLLLSPDFLVRAAAEMRARQFDYFFPQSRINYLSHTDSEDVMAGVRSPADCRPVNVLRPPAGNAGAAGMVRKAFVLQFGGFHEGFRGWGGEDDGWLHKARLLGRVGVTSRQDQTLYHLHHPDSGGYAGGGQIANNPHYGVNVSLLRTIRSIRGRDLFLNQFPPPAKASCPWNVTDRLTFISARDDAGMDRLANQTLQYLSSQYGANIDQRSAAAGDSTWAEELIDAPPNAVVLFGSSAASIFFSALSLAQLYPRAAVVLDKEDDVAPAHAGAVVTGAELSRRLRERGADPWTWAPADGGDEATSIALALVQPLSLLIAGQSAEAGKSSDPDNGSIISNKFMSEDKKMTLPVWMYWEGECPEWIRMCQDTVRAHAKDVRLITRDEFERLRDVDQDIDIDRLAIPHRADYIRAFLLARYGGLWVDSDCLVMKSLETLIESLNEVDFIAHRERSGFVSNGFIGARPGSSIASAYYARVCEILRSRKPLGWITIGGELLTEILRMNPPAWRELDCESIQPVCWSNPGAFFQTAQTEEHDLAFSRAAICYMMSNTEVKKFLSGNPTKSLLDDGTFFLYLAAKARETRAECAAKEVRRSDWKQIPFALEAISDVAPTKVLDVGVGSGRWGLLLREFFESSDRRLRVEGIQMISGRSGGYQETLYDSVHEATNGDLLSSIDGDWDLVILGDGIGEAAAPTKVEILNRALGASGYVLVNGFANFNGALSGNGVGTSDQARPTNGDQENDSLSVLDAHAIRSLTYEGPGGAIDGVLLLSRSDPRGLRTEPAMEEIFSKAIETYVQVRDESLSGPGSCLAQTAEIRQRLPLLIQDIGVRSMLDAPCGDFNWMRNVVLGGVQYIGVDVVQRLIEQNRARYANESRRFLRLDVTRDPLPKADLILCRDCLVHFSYEELFRALRNFKRSGSRYLLTTTFPRVRSNSDIATGDWRPLNLQLHPFDFPAPTRLINEKCTEAGGRYSDKSLGLWELQHIKVVWS